ncbi:Ribonuclease T2-like [Trema orientale]|uniref:Ribonuclease T2-like n=1 Tax=Trema orientale TaxID=63057 RepID=A0A2P5CCA4_TREOI|nr:Ribonuclease T2-like [Trema orientale]
MSQCGASFEFYYFVLTWPESLCNLDTKPCCYPKKGGKPAADFIIHGLWPNFRNGSFPTYCDPKSPYDRKQLSSFIGSMKKYWPSMSCPRNDGTRFWSHEWVKHGTCSKSVLDQRNYFLTTLNLRMKVNILLALKRAGIEPNGKSYSLTAMKSAITRAIGYTPNIKCSENKWEQFQLHEVYFCVDINSHLMPCAAQGFEDHCGGNTEIYFHKF